MAKLIRSILTFLLAFLVAGSLCNLSDHPHWFVRGWDFPRVQIIVLAWLLACGVAAAHWFGKSETRKSLFTALGFATFLTAWHGYLIFPYTPLATTQAKATRAVESQAEINSKSLRVVVSNVKKENDQYERWIDGMQQADPDLLIVLEPNQTWADAIKSYTETFEESIIVPQENYYGMMLLSKLPIRKHEVRYLVQDDVPSIDAEVLQRDGDVMRVIAVHPRPPEPIRQTDAVARDAELTLWGKELSKQDRPTIIGGDLNDVAWSPTTSLFLRKSKMLDPRRGRGMFNTFHADHFYMRFPLDHLFISPDFTISGIKRLPYVGSDHFPIQIDLHHAPEEKNEHRVLKEEPGDDEEAQEKIERAVENKETKGEAVEEADPDKTKAMSL